MPDPLDPSEWAYITAWPNPFLDESDFFAAVTGEQLDRHMFLVGTTVYMRADIDGETVPVGRVARLEPEPLTPHYPAWRIYLTDFQWWRPRPLHGGFTWVTDPAETFAAVRARWQAHPRALPWGHTDVDRRVDAIIADIGDLVGGVLGLPEVGAHLTGALESCRAESRHSMSSPSWNPSANPSAPAPWYYGWVPQVGSPIGYVDRGGQLHVGIMAEGSHDRHIVVDEPDDPIERAMRTINSCRADFDVMSNDGPTEPTARWWHSYDIQQHRPQLKIDGRTDPQTYGYHVGDSAVELEPDENKGFYSFSEDDGWVAIRCVRPPAAGTWHEGRPA
jgi:hypothetical protein